MTKIAVVTESNPFDETPRVFLAQTLVERLQQNGHDSYLVKVPVDWRNGDTLMQSILAIRLLRLQNVDRIVAIDFPAAIVQHADKYAWLTQNPQDVTESNYEHMLAKTGRLAQAEAESTPHRLTIMQDLLKRMYYSYIGECQKTIYCKNALFEDDEQPENTAEQMALTASLKSSLIELAPKSDKEVMDKMPSLVVPPFHAGANFLAEIPWSEIIIYLT